jgi:hypothetical protein
MSHDRDHDHRTPPAPPPREPHLDSTDCPDCKRTQRPTDVPREPVDPRPHPSRRMVARAARGIASARRPVLTRFGARPA